MCVCVRAFGLGLPRTSHLAACRKVVDTPSYEVFSLKFLQTLSKFFRSAATCKSLGNDAIALQVCDRNDLGEKILKHVMVGDFIHSIFIHSISIHFTQTAIRVDLMPGPGPTLTQLAQNVGEGATASEKRAGESCANLFFLAAT